MEKKVTTTVPSEKGRGSQPSPGHTPRPTRPTPGTEQRSLPDTGGAIRPPKKR